MQPHIGVGMADEAPAMGDLDAAQPHRSALAKGVDIKSHAGARRHRRRNGPFGPAEIVRRRQFLQHFIPANLRYPEARRARNFGVICRLAPGPGAMGGKNGIEAERLWRSEEHTSELQSLMRTSYAVFCL